MTISSNLDNVVKLVEMGPRDGLQSENTFIATPLKIALINRLSDCGLKHIETGSFVSPKWVPQMADSTAVFAGIQRRPDIIYSALTPNLLGWSQALNAQADEIAIFASASESFSQQNLNCDVRTSLSRFAPVVEAAQKAGVKVRAYVSCVMGCPYEGEILPQNVLTLIQKLLSMGCYEVSLGDTIGVGTPGKTRKLLSFVLSYIPAGNLAMHMHDTYGQAIANIYTSLELGIRTFDASVGGLGGCPYAKGATGNVASEDLVYLLETEGFEHGIDLTALAETGVWINQQLNKTNHSRAGLAIHQKRKKQCS
jgi:hydroxymethylglutaryl-CoA lyase